jgi:antitoxin ParD1/3/4
MNVQLTPELEDFIASQLKSGKYASAEEIMVAGIRLLRAWEQSYKIKLEVLQREIERERQSPEGRTIINYEVFLAQLQSTIKAEIAYKKDWSPCFFEEVIGGWAGEPLERAEQGEFEMREVWL